MRLSTKSRYGLRVVLRLALESRGGESVPLWRLAEAEGISKKYMEHIAAQLERSGIIEGSRGPGGGYRLARRPREISVLDVVSAVENTYILPCAMDPLSCERSDDCLARPFWVSLQGHMRRFMSSASIENLINKEQLK